MFWSRLMFVRITTERTPRPNALDEFGVTSSSDANVSLNEFTYKRGTEIFGEKEPAEYVYQVKTGAVRSYKLLSDPNSPMSLRHTRAPCPSRRQKRPHHGVAGRG